MIITGKTLPFGTSVAGNGGTPVSGGDTLAKSQNGADISDKAKFRRNIGVDGLTLSGPALVYPGVTHEYTITGWSDFSAYDVSVSTGTASVKNGVITLLVPVDATGAITLTVTRNNVQYAFTLDVSPVFILPPQITSPTDGSTGVDFNATMTVSDFVCSREGADSYLKTQWEVSAGPGYYTDEEIALAEFNGELIQEYNVVAVRDSSGTTLALDIPVVVSDDSEEGVLNQLTSNWNIKYRPEDNRSYRVRRGATYRVRARHVGRSLVSGWSGYVTFTISDEPIVKPVIMLPANGETDVDAAAVIQASAFSLQHGAEDELSASEWQIATDADFTDVVWQKTGNDSTATISGNTLKRSSIYYARMRYKGGKTGYSAYSDSVNFTTAPHFLPTKEIAMILQPDGAPDAHFNTPVFSRDGEWLFVGAPNAYDDSGSGSKSGVVYALKKNGQTWVLAQAITQTTARDWQQFGRGLAFATSSLFVSSMDGVYEYTLSGDNWVGSVVSEGYSSSPNSDKFSVSSDGNTVAFQVYVYSFGYIARVLTRRDGVWTPLSIQAPEKRLEFAHSMSVSSDGAVLAVGAKTSNDPPVKNAVYVYRFTDSGWVPEYTVREPETFKNSVFGEKVVISPDGLLLFAAGGEKYNAPDSFIYAWRFENGEWKESGRVSISAGGEYVGFKFARDMLICRQTNMEYIRDTGTHKVVSRAGFYSVNPDNGHLTLKASAETISFVSGVDSQITDGFALSDDGATLAMGVYDSTQGTNSNAVVIFTEGGAAE